MLHEYWTQAVKTSLADTNTRIDSLEKELEETSKALHTAQANIDELEQYSRRNALRIWFPQPEVRGENTDELVSQYAKKKLV